MMKPPATERLTRTVTASPIPAGARIVVAVSGGADSVALARALYGAATERCWSLRLAHVHHGLRGKDADGDARFVEQLAQELDLPFDMRQVDTALHATQHRISTETAARELRYAALRAMLSGWPGDLIATGHTRDDQAETVLLHLLRGSGLDGATAMARRTGCVVRPVLSIGRDTVLRALSDWNLEYRTDASNADTRFRRNQLRATVMPALHALQPEASTTLARAADLLAVDADFIRQEVRDALARLDLEVGVGQIVASRTVMLRLHPALQRHVVRELVQRVLGHRRDIEAQHVALMVAALEGASKGPTHRSGGLPHGLRLSIHDHRFTLQTGDSAAPPAPFHGALPVPGNIQTPNGTLSIEVLEGLSAGDLAARLANRTAHEAFADAAALSKSLTVRSWRPGDRVRPLGMMGRRKLQDIFVDQKIPREQRVTLPIVESANEVVWVPGVVISEALRIRGEPAGVAHARYKPL